MAGCCIRDATEADLPHIVGSHDSMVPLRNVTADTEPVTVGSRRAWLWEHGGRRPVEVAEEGGEIVGWLASSGFQNGRPAFRATAEVEAYVKEGGGGRVMGRSLLDEVIRRSPAFGLKTVTAGAFGHDGSSLRLSEALDFERCAFYWGVAELDGVERDLAVLGLGREGGGSV